MYHLDEKFAKDIEDKQLLLSSERNDLYKKILEFNRSTVRKALNKSRTKKDFPIGCVVLIKDFTLKPSSKLNGRYHLYPYKVIKQSNQTLLVRNILTKFETLVSKNMVKPILAFNSNLLSEEILSNLGVLSNKDIASINLDIMPNIFTTFEQLEKANTIQTRSKTNVLQKVVGFA